VGRSLGWGEPVVVSDLRNDGDISVTEDFYVEMRRLDREADATSGLFDQEETRDIIARCRVLRWLEPKLARRMVHAMAIVLDRAIEKVSPRVVLSFPIDRYVMDLLERLANRRGIPYLELTANVIPGQSMLMYRGMLVKGSEVPEASRIDDVVRQIAVPDFIPSYVAQQVTYTRKRFTKTLAYFRLRGAFFKLLSLAKRDPFGLHYLDSQSYLGHKSRWRDIRIVSLCNQAWRDALRDFPRERRIMFALQLFPEASIDYWLRNPELIEHEALLLEAAQAFSSAGYQVLVKDHPSQFGFRQTAFIERLMALRNVVLVPYEVKGTELISVCGASFTCTGTLGFQAALAGLKSVAAKTYYTTADDFVVFDSRAEIGDLPRRVAEFPECSDLPARRRRLVSHLLQGSFEADFFSFRGFDPQAPSPAATELGRALGRQLDSLVSENVI
jgi:hypothetical protein